MKKFLDTVRGKIGRIMFFVLFFSLFPVAVEYYTIYFSSREDWFEYTNLTVIETPGVNKEDRSIEVYSYAVIKRPVQIEWIDVLWCKGEYGFERVESHISSAYFTEPTVLPRTTIDEFTGLAVQIPWRFGVSRELTTGDLCYIESTVTAKLAYEQNRTQVVKSNQFNIK